MALYAAKYSRMNYQLVFIKCIAVFTSFAMAIPGRRAGKSAAVVAYLRRQNPARSSVCMVEAAGFIVWRLWYDVTRLNN